MFPYATASDLKQELSDRARIMATNRSPYHPWERMTNDEILRSAGLYKKNLQTGKADIRLLAFYFSERMRRFYRTATILYYGGR